MPMAAQLPASETIGRLLGPRTLISDLLSFEAVFLLFIYSDSLQVVLPWLPMDPSLPLFALSAAVGGIVILREGIYLRGTIVVAAFLPFLAWLTMSLQWTPSRILAYDYLKIMLTVNLWCVVAGAMIVAHKRERMLRFLKIMVGLSVLVALMGTYIYFVYGSFKYAGWEDVGRVYNQWGRSTANGTVVLLFLFLRSRVGTLRHLVTAGLLAICTFFILIASSRSALLSVMTPCLLLLAVTASPVGRQGLNMSRGALILPLLLTLVLAGISVLLATGYRVDTVNRLLRVLDQAENTELVLGPNRWAYYRAALALIIESPVIGHGVRSFSVLYRNAELPGSHPHNIFLEVLSDTGFIGLALFLFFFYVACRALRPRVLAADPMLLALGMLFVSRLTATMFGADLSFQQELFAYAGLLALRPAGEPAAGRGAAPFGSRRAPGLASRKPAPT